MTMTGFALGRRAFMLAAMLLAATGLAASAQEQARREIVRFAPGGSQAVLKGAIKGWESVDYVVAAKAGQTLSIRFRPSRSAAFFNVMPPGGGEALFVGQSEGQPNDFTTVLKLDGDYLVQVYLVRAAARRAEKATYTLRISIGADPAHKDFADALSGGPDVWQVSGVAAGDVLNIRRGPAAREPAVGIAVNGDRLRNTGCRIVLGQRWCKVERLAGPSATGWVAGRYLREAGPN
jgi:hypothetical protein